ncbi:hypothetical protein CEXT_7261 [Caerostris extrusa]|uniref:Uncharacterized protein n=1 Tax=Caerostris extrusa TaxID=172846 RepID=A0AAV4XN82_CAEEX|nr:hypothetical protein CEXT_7261 [Caerostris extrusa]
MKKSLNMIKQNVQLLREIEPTAYTCLQNCKKARRMVNETHVQFTESFGENEFSQTCKGWKPLITKKSSICELWLTLDDMVVHSTCGRKMCLQTEPTSTNVPEGLRK